MSEGEIPVTMAGAVLEATLEQITFANPETGYTVARVDPGRGGDLVTVVQSLLGAQPGETLRLRGRWGAPTLVVVGGRTCSRRRSRRKPSPTRSPVPATHC